MTEDGGTVFSVCVCVCVGVCMCVVCIERIALVYISIGGYVTCAVYLCVVCIECVTCIRVVSVRCTYTRCLFNFALVVHSQTFFSVATSQMSQ